MLALLNVAEEVIRQEKRLSIVEKLLTEKIGQLHALLNGEK